MRRGQAALEFLTTYGWAMLIILTMIGALSYFGIVNPQKLLPSRCLVTTDFSCRDYILDSHDNTAKIALSQGTGKTIWVTDLKCNHDGVDSDIEVANVPVGCDPIIPGCQTILPSAPQVGWSPRQKVEFQCVFNSGSLSAVQGQKTKVEYTITYTLQPDSPFEHIVQGEIYSEVQ
ncbi:hypothetical protein GOV11_02065 [Candidatus Woesearchaeota archaeon]|nr:hypothetical protein [Candidatus Woesearchaeota archaeon]